MVKLKNNRGFTLAEMLFVVAIIIILAAVGFIEVPKYQRSMGQVERDGMAKEIFVAAQNHLTAAYGASYYGLDKNTNLGSGGPFGYKESEGIYYFVVSNGESGIGSPNVLEQMLPFGSIDENVRTSGSYIIRYQKDTGLVLDVFYCSTGTSPAEYNHSLAVSDYATVKGLAGDTSSDKTGRRSWNGSIVGWYGGVSAANLPTGTPLVAPVIKIINEEILYVEVTDKNSSTAKLKLIITGVESGAQKAYDLLPPDDSNRIKPAILNYTYNVILDDVTNAARHFGKIPADKGSFIPGEDIEIQAVAYSTSEIRNIAYSPKGVTNSLFGSINDKAVDIDGTSYAKNNVAYINNIRHLENLDRVVSGLDNNDTGNKLNIQMAQQTTNMSWSDFQTRILSLPGAVGAVTVTDCAVPVNQTASGKYMPISPNYALIYDGRNHSISEISVSSTTDGGLFGFISSVTAIKNLELIDFDITALGNAGALAGQTAGCAITNVLARNSADSSAVNITGAAAGGLVGKLASGSIEYSAAAVIVNGSSTGGGLVGSAAGSITACYSGGHTKEASYDEWIKSYHYDVEGGTVGGLAGTLSGATITDSYSTCSVSGTTAGGFVGTSSGGTINGSYSTGLVKGSGAEYAFLADDSASLSGNFYYSIINDRKVTTAQGPAIETLPPVVGYGVDIAESWIKSIDQDIDTYNTFVGAPSTWNNAIPYDPVLVKYYRKSDEVLGRYSLETVKQLHGSVPDGYFVSIHYGDWPAPEIFVEND